MCPGAGLLLWAHYSPVFTGTRVATPVSCQNTPKHPQKWPKNTILSRCEHFAVGTPSPLELWISEIWGWGPQNGTFCLQKPHFFGFTGVLWRKRPKKWSKNVTQNRTPQILPFLSTFCQKRPKNGPKIALFWPFFTSGAPLGQVLSTFCHKLGEWQQRLKRTGEHKRGTFWHILALFHTWWKQVCPKHRLITSETQKWQKSAKNDTFCTKKRAQNTLRIVKNYVHFWKEVLQNQVDSVVDLSGGLPRPEKAFSDTLKSVEKTCFWHKNYHFFHTFSCPEVTPRGPNTDSAQRVAKSTQKVLKNVT